MYSKYMQHNCMGFCTKCTAIFFSDCRGNWRPGLLFSTVLSEHPDQSHLLALCMAKLIVNYILPSSMASQEEADDPIFLERAMPPG